MDLRNPIDVVEQFNDLIKDMAEEIHRQTKDLDLSERHYKKNIAKVAMIDVTSIYYTLMAFFDCIDEYKSSVALENDFFDRKLDYEPIVRHFCDDYIDLVSVAMSIKQVLDERSGLLGMFKGYSNPVETLLRGTSYRMNFQQLRHQFSYQAALLADSEKKLFSFVRDELNNFLTNFN